MIVFLFNEYPMLDYIESFSLDADRIMSHIMTIRDRDGIYLLCKLLACFRSLIHQ